MTYARDQSYYVAATAEVRHLAPNYLSYGDRENV
jgi:hypothetical protein